LHGFGVDRDPSAGLKLILEAASGPNPVLRAKFDIARMIEKGYGDVIQRNHVLAIKYYRGVCLAVAIPRAADKERILDFAKSHLHDNKDFHDTDNSLDSYAGRGLSCTASLQARLSYLGRLAPGLLLLP
jgi:hypothetical protein